MYPDHSSSGSGPQYPFLGLQKNALLRRVLAKEDNLPEWISSSPHFLYQKPFEICENEPQLLPVHWNGPEAFSYELKAIIERYILSMGLKIRLMKNEDTPGVLEFLSRRYPPHIASEISPFDLYRFRNFGHGILLEDQHGKIQGTIFEEVYGTVEKTSYTMRLAVSEDYKGKKLGYYVMVYSSLFAMDRGSRVKRGIIEFYNHKSLHINLNKVGWICDGFEPHISGLGAFFRIALPLTPRGLTANQVNMGKLNEFIINHDRERDYQLVPVDDYEAICHMYQSTDFKVVAYIQANLINKRPYFFALPSKSLNMCTDCLEWQIG
ncbi:MAG: hypothetical protein R3C61_10295 [Bacteroidia bacterium]